MNERCDVAVIGFGPVGATLAALLAKRGLSVVALDKDVDIYALPRAAHLDAEVMRVWQEVGCADELIGAMRENVGMDFLSANGALLHRMRSPGLAPSGWPSSLFFHQPGVERTLRKTAIECGVQTRLGAEVVALTHDDTGARVICADGSTIDAAWVIGCDGARSFVRKTLGIEMDDLEFEEPWLVIDCVVRGDAPNLPDRALQICDPARPHTLVPMPAPRFRFEFMLLPGEDETDLDVRELVRPWVHPDNIEVERSAVYTFHGLIARQWRAGRMLLAGDAAHQMPPFLGQGMCSGIRDAANLAWKLDLVHRGRARDALLDTYQQEREPHVRTIVELAVSFGRIICTTDAEVARERDAAMSASVQDNVATVTFDNRVYASQPCVNRVRLDDLVGQRFAVITREPQRNTVWEQHAIMLDALAHPELAPLLDARETEKLVIRPDRYVADDLVLEHLV